MVADFQAALAQLRKEYYWDQLPIQPDVDEKGIEDTEQFEVEEDLSKGAVLKGILKQGSGDVPQKQDLVFLHITLIKGEHVIWSTRSEYGGQGHAEPYLLGKSKSLIKGIELAVLRMQQGEQASLEIQPQYAYQHPSWTAAVPNGLRPDETVNADVELVQVVPSRKIRALHEHADTYKLIGELGDEWETPRAPYRVSFHVKASLASQGSEEAAEPYFSTAGSAPVEAILGSKVLPPGLDAGLATMVRGETSTISCPRTVSRGMSTSIPDPPSSSKAGRVDFEVTLLDFTQIRDLTGDGGIVKEITQRGEGVFPVDCPVEDSHIAVHWRVRHHGDSGPWVFDSQSSGQNNPVEFDTGMATVPDAVDMAVRLMLKGETSLVTSEWDRAFHREEDAPEGLQRGSKLDFEVTMVDFHRDTIREDTSLEERVQIATKWKEQGNQLYKRGELKLAKAKYLKASKLMERTGAPDEETHQANTSLQVSCYLNLALCAQKQQEAAEAIHYTNKALEFDPRNAKVYFRRAQAMCLLGKYEEANEDLDEALEIDSGLEADVSREKARMAAQEKKEEAKQRAQFGKFFK